MVLDDQMTTMDTTRLVTILIDFISSLIFIGIITLRIKWRIFPSDYAVKLTNISKEFKGDIEADIRKLFEEKFGKIHEIAVIKETGEILSYQMQLHRVSEMVGDIKAKNEILGKQDSKTLIKIYKSESNINAKLSKEIGKIDKTKMEIGKSTIKEIYIIFEMPIDKNKLINGIKEINDDVEVFKENKKSKKFL